MSVVLPATETLLVSGGDGRILPDPVSGVSVYGFRPRPDPELVGLGSSTASVISAAGYAAAEALRRACTEKLRLLPPHRVYAEETGRLRGDLLRLCGFPPAAGVDAVLAASGTDLHLLVAQWLKPQRIVMVAAPETGSGVPAAVQGRHFNSRTALGGAVAVGDALGDWQGEVATLAPRNPDGSLRDGATVDAECAARVAETAASGRRVLLVLTDQSKTGLIVPGIDIVRQLQARWPERVEVLVDACQFRLAPQTVRAYAMQGWLIALTGSKFMAGPSFCGALLVPPGVAARHRDAPLPPALAAYSCAADWPADWRAARALPAAANFGLLLRWEAALVELRAFAALPDVRIAAFLREFGRAVRQRLAADDGLRELPVRPLSRPTLDGTVQWDGEQTIFPFLLYGGGEGGARRPLCCDETRRIHQALLQPTWENAGRRFQFGQPVACGQREGVAVGALRLCVSARMVVAACRDRSAAEVIGDALAGLDAIGRLPGRR